MRLLRWAIAIVMLASGARADIGRCPLNQVVITEQPGETIIRCGEEPLAAAPFKHAPMRPRHRGVIHRYVHHTHHQHARSLFDLLFRRR